MIKCDDWRPSSELVLEPNAKTAATFRSGSIALLAGPGAGKTEMLAQRADFLLRTGACIYPKRILAISFKKDASENLKQRVEKRCGRELASRFDSYTFHAFSKRIIDIFRPFLSGQDALVENYTVGLHRVDKTQITFNDMVPLANDIVRECSAAINSIRHTYTDVFLDEFQDCTDSQYSLIKKVFTGISCRLVAVGDTKQKIMGWAGALEGVFLEFGKDFGATPLNLYQNFRSSPRIRRVHNSMVKDIDPQAAVDDKQLEGEGGIVSIEKFSSEREEAIWISESIELWATQGMPYKEIAVLCNTQPHLYANCLMEELGNRDIPFRNEQEIQDLFCEPIFRIIVDYLVVLLGISEPDSWDRLFSVITPDSFEDMDDSKNRGWNQFILMQQAMLDGARDFLTIWNSVEDLIQQLGNDAITGLSHDYENKIRFQELVDQTKNHVQSCFAGTKDVVESLKGISEINAVRILTIHKCKGLEFETVIVQGVEEETFFGDNPEFVYFVALSRAKERLVVTAAEHRTKLPGANQRWSVSRTPHQKFLGYISPHVGGK